jgi:hypothetical protein
MRMAAIAGLLVSLAACAGQSTSAPPSHQAPGGIAYCVGASPAFPAGSHVLVTAKRGDRLLLEVGDVVPTSNTFAVSPGPVQLWIRGHEVYQATVESGVLTAGHQGAHCTHHPAPIPPE